jgi:type 1 glutamine amidotransferase
LSVTADLALGERIDVVLVAGGVWHDIDFARLQLLTLLAEHEELRVRCQADFEDSAWFEPGAVHRARILVTYTCDVRPSARAQRVIRDWIERGGRMVALHGTNCALDQSPAGWAASCDLPLWFDTLGSQFIAHPPIAPYLVENVADHWLVAGLESFEATDEQYLNAYPDRAALVPLLQTTYHGQARGFAEGDWSEADPVHLVMYLRPLGAGAVLYNTLGHCRGHYDMVPLKNYHPTVDRCSWELPVFHELLRRSIRWARGDEPA